MFEFYKINSKRSTDGHYDKGSGQMHESSKRLCAFVRSAPADILGAESDYEFPKCVNS